MSQVTKTLLLFQLHGTIGVHGELAVKHVVEEPEQEQELVIQAVLLALQEVLQKMKAATMRHVV